MVWAVYNHMGFQAFNPSFEANVRDSFSQQTAMTTIGAQLIRVEPGVVEIMIPYRANLTQQHGYLHGGIITTIADTACGYAAYTLMPADSEVLSVEFKVNLLRPAKGKSFVATAEVIKPGRTLTVARADVLSVDEAEKRELIATMQATIICLGK
jgi:uncharacterized protein (TIGR00369 family)